MTGQSFENGKWQIEAAGTYSLNGDKLYTRSDYDRDGVATIVSKSSSKLVLESYEKDGDGEHYEKITLERVN